MVIQNLKIRNNHLGIEFEKIDFFKLTLLVGISGAGKTQLLNSITDLIKIAKGKSISGLEWNFTCNNIKGDVFNWNGKYETLETDSVFDDEDEKNNTEENKPKIGFEELIVNGKTVVKRSEEQILFNNNKMPKLSSFQSLIYILKEEAIIKSVYDALKKIIFRDNTSSEIGFKLSDKPLSAIKGKYKIIKEIRESELDIRLKLYLCYENEKDVFEEIKNHYLSIFPNVEDIKIEPIEDKNTPVFLIDRLPFIQIKERGVEKWIKENKISSGMLKSLLHISELYLLSEGSVILIDEFENSLGVNCIDFLTDDLIHENSKIQFIATSHHPYVINNIPYEYWKVVTRKGGLINIKDAKDFKLGKSKQQAFVQLTKILDNQ